MSNQNTKRCEPASSRRHVATSPRSARSYTPDFALHSPDEVRGADGLYSMVERYRRALPTWS